MVSTFVRWPQNKLDGNLTVCISFFCMSALCFTQMAKYKQNRLFHFPEWSLFYCTLEVKWPNIDKWTFPYQGKLKSTPLPRSKMAKWKQNGFDFFSFYPHPQKLIWPNRNKTDFSILGDWQNINRQTSSEKHSLNFLSWSFSDGGGGGKKLDWNLKLSTNTADLSCNSFLQLKSDQAYHWLKRFFI